MLERTLASRSLASLFSYAKLPLVPVRDTMVHTSNKSGGNVPGVSQRAQVFTSTETVSRLWHGQALTWRQWQISLSSIASPT